MPSPLKKAINFVQAGNPTRMGEVVADTLRQKAVERIEAKHADIAKDLLQLPTTEAVGPRSAGEKAFVKLHKIQDHGHPVATEIQFKGSKGKSLSGKRPADSDVGDRDGIVDDPESTTERLKRLTVHSPGIGMAAEGKT